MGITSDELKDNTMQAKIDAILENLGGSSADLPDNLLSTKLKAIINNTANGGGGGAEYTEPIPLDPPNNVRIDAPHQVGTYWNGGSDGNGFYFHCHIENVQEGDIIHWALDNNGEYAFLTDGMNAVDAYNGNTRVAEACVNNWPGHYTVPTGVDNIYVSCYAKYNSYYSAFIVKTITNGFVTKTIQDLANKVNNDRKYSTEEIPIGTWIDGRTIYRKVYTSFIWGSPAYVTKELNRNNCTPIKLDGFYVTSSNESYIPFNSQWSAIYIDNTGIAFQSQSISSASQIHVIVEYVKQ